MKKYLFGLGAMVVGAGLMFALMHGEVGAETDGEKESVKDKARAIALNRGWTPPISPGIPDRFICSDVGAMKYNERSRKVPVVHCLNEILTCAYEPSVGLSCVKRF